MNRADSVARIVLTCQQHFGFGLADLVFETRQQYTQLLQRSFILFGKLKEHPGVGNLSFELLLPLNRSFQPTTVLQKLLCGFLIRPEIGRRSPGLNLV